MIISLDALVHESLIEFLQFNLCHKLRAFKNKTIPLFQQNSSRFPYKSVYAGTERQWIYDSSLSGAQIPSGIGGINRGESGLYIDFYNGRALLNSGTPLVNPTVNVAIPEFNIYVTTKPTSELMFVTKFNKPPTMFPPDGPLAEDAIVAPCIFVKYLNSKNIPYALGGVEATKWDIQLSVFAEDYFSLYGVQSIVRDVRDTIFPLLDKGTLNEYDDLKETFNYSDKMASINQRNMIHVDDATFKIIDSDFINDSNPTMLAGIGRIELTVYRQKTDNY